MCGDAASPCRPQSVTSISRERSLHREFPHGVLTRTLHGAGTKKKLQTTHGPKSVVKIFDHHYSTVLIVLVLVSTHTRGPAVYLRLLRSFRSRSRLKHEDGDQFKFSGIELSRCRHSGPAGPETDEAEIPGHGPRPRISSLRN